MSELLTIPQICKRCDVGVPTVRTWIRRSALFGSHNGMTFTDSGERTKIFRSSFKLYHVTGLAPEAEAVATPAPEPRQNRPVNFDKHGARLSVSLTNSHIETAKRQGVDPVAYAVAALTNRPTGKVTVLRDELLIWSRERQQCAAGYLSHWISVPLPAALCTVFQRWADYGDKPYPVQFDLCIPKEYML